MKIGILVYRINGVGGIEKITAQKINAWIEMFGYEVVLITKNNIDAAFIFDINKKCKFYNLAIPSQLSGGLPQYVKNIPKVFKLYKGVEKILKSEKIDILFTTMIGVDSLIIPFVQIKIPKILEFHRSVFLFNSKAWFFKKTLIQFYDKVIFLNETEKKYFNLKNSIVIPNFVDGKHLDSKQERKKIIITAGRISWEKQFDHLVDIWSIVSLKYPDWKVHIYGNGNLESLNKKILEQKLEQSFKIFPATTEIINKMQEASIFALVSATEAFPMVLLEAMSAKLPIVSYDSPHGPKNIVTDGKDGFILPLNDKVAFAEKLNILIQNPVLRDDFVKNQKTKLELFSKEKVMNQWNDLVMSLLSN